MNPHGPVALSATTRRSGRPRPQDGDVRQFETFRAQTQPGAGAPVVVPQAQPCCFGLMYTPSAG